MSNVKSDYSSPRHRLTPIPPTHRLRHRASAALVPSFALSSSYRPGRDGLPPWRVRMAFAVIPPGVLAGARRGTHGATDPCRRSGGGQPGSRGRTTCSSPWRRMVAVTSPPPVSKAGAAADVFGRWPLKAPPSVRAAAAAAAAAVPAAAEVPVRRRVAPSRQSVAAAAAVAGLLAGGVLAGGPSVPPAAAFSPEQKLLAEVWRIVDDSYVDRTFNGQVR